MALLIRETLLCYSFINSEYFLVDRTWSWILQHRPLYRNIAWRKICFIINAFSTEFTCQT